MGELSRPTASRATGWRSADAPEADQLLPLDTDADPWSQLNKLAFWMATGSGKTLVMHANILQFQHYLAKHGRRRELNRIILLTHRSINNVERDRFGCERMAARKRTARRVRRRESYSVTWGRTVVTTSRALSRASTASDSR